MNRPAKRRTILVAASVAVIVLFSIPLLYYSEERSTSRSSSPTASTTGIPAISLSNTTGFCTYPSGSGEVYLRVLPDSGSTPLAGALVTTSREFPYTCIPPGPAASTTSQEYENFTTTNTEWYAFGGLNPGTFSFSVEYRGQTFDMTESQRVGPVSTCVTLHIPSGMVDTTYVANGQSCPETASLTTVTATTTVTETITAQASTSTFYTANCTLLMPTVTTTTTTTIVVEPQPPVSTTTVTVATTSTRYSQTVTVTSCIATVATVTTTVTATTTK